MRNKARLTFLTVVTASLLGVFAPSTSEGLAFPIFPTFFPPFADTGTVVQLESDGDLCLAWRADSDSALYFFTGLDDFEPGDRLLVEGNLCLICLVQLTCGFPVSPILNAVITPL